MAPDASGQGGAVERERPQRRAHAAPASAPRRTCVEIADPRGGRGERPRSPCRRRPRARPSAPSRRAAPASRASRDSACARGREKPSARSAVSAAPCRDTPGTSAQACASPTQRARLRSGPAPRLRVGAWSLALTSVGEGHREAAGDEADRRRLRGAEALLDRALEAATPASAAGSVAATSHARRRAGGRGRRACRRGARPRAPCAARGRGPPSSRPAWADEETGSSSAGPVQQAEREGARARPHRRRRLGLRAPLRSAGS